MNVPETTDCLYYLITRATLLSTARLRHELADAGVWQVRPAYLGVLLALSQEEGLRAGDLGRRAGLEPSTMTGLLDRMERDTLIERRADPRDRRALRIFLTDEGREVMVPAMDAVDRTMAAMLDGVTDDDQQRVKATLRRVLENTAR